MDIKGEDRTCRLCFNSQAHLFDIYEEYELNIADVISEHIGQVRKHHHYYFSFFQFLFAWNYNWYF